MAEKNMWNIFKKKEWIDEMLSVICGVAEDLHVTIYNFPCRRAMGKATKHYRYPDFGHEFIIELSERQLSDFTTIAAALSEGKAIRVPVKLKNLPEITVQIQGRPNSRKSQFYSDIADSIIDAFEKYGIKP